MKNLQQDHTSDSNANAKFNIKCEYHIRFKVRIHSLAMQTEMTMHCFMKDNKNGQTCVTV